MKITPIGIDLAKNVFQARGTGARGKAALRKQLRRDQVTVFFAICRHSVPLGVLVPHR